MKHLKTLGLAAVAAMALTGISASSAAATTFEVGGTAKNASITITGSLEKEASAKLEDTTGTIHNTCVEGEGTASTESPFTGEAVGGANLSKSLGSCTRPITLHKTGSIRVEHIASTTNGTVVSVGAEITSSTSLGTINCKTGAGTVMGVLTGKASGQATLDVNAVVNCGFLLPSTKVSGVFVATTPEAFGVVS
jgi:hypothetical protein